MYKFLAFTIFFIPTAAFSECSENSCKDVTITRLYVQPHGGTVIGTSGDESLLNCDAEGGVYIKLDRESPNYNSVYSLILSAHMAQHPVWVRASESGDCKVNYVVSDR